MRTYLTPKWVSIFTFLLIILGLCNERTYEASLLTASLLFLYMLIIAIHELGHVISGKVSGFEFVFFTVGPIQIEKSVHGYVLKENKQWIYFGGVSLMTPPVLTYEKMIKKWLVYVAGGPLISFISGMLKVNVDF